MAKQLAQYKKIENDLLESIRNGIYENGSMIPTELELSKKYNVSRVTVRRATENLVSNGYVKRTPGSGTVVTYSKRTNTAPKVMGFMDQMKKLGKKVTSEVKTFIIEEATGSSQKVLGLSAGDRVYYIERVRKADGKVYLFEVSHISVDRFPELSVSYLENSKYDFFQSIKGITLNQQKHIVRPGLSDQKISEILGIELNSPILVVENFTYAKDGTVVDYSTNYYNPDEYELCYIKGS